MKYKYRITPQKPKMIELERVTGGIGFRYDKPQTKDQKHKTIRTFD